jgi:hypothetical protein
MATITPAAVIPVASPYNTSPSYSGTFIPSIWSAKLNAKFYAATVFNEIANTNWQGDISDVGDKVVINDIPDLAISTYTPGTAISYTVPTPSSQELQIKNAKMFAFRTDDILKMQSKIPLMDTFTADAGMQMKIAIDGDVILKMLFDATDGGVDAANGNSATGGRSAAYNLGTGAAPITLSGSNTLSTITNLASVLDEWNVPDSDRWLLIDPATRSWLMQSNLAQAYFTGDATSPVRNGLIGTIDRFKVFVTNQLPTAASGQTTWTNPQGSTAGTVATHATLKRRLIVAGHKSGVTFASQMTKVETLRIQDNFGDYVRGLNVYGFKTVKKTSLAYAIVA